MKKFTRIACIILGVLMLLSAAGCGQTNNSTNGGSTQPADSAAANGSTAQAGGGEIKLVVSSMWAPGSDEIANIFYAALDKYQKDNPNIKFETQAVGHDDYQVKISTMIASGKVPDIFQYKGGMIYDIVKNNLAQPLNDMLNNDKAWYDRFYPGIFGDFTYQDKIYGIPFQAQSCEVVYYNKDLVGQVGVTTFPKTWDEFKDLLNKLKAKGITPIAIGNKDGWPLESDVFSGIVDKVTGDEWFTSLKNKTGAKFTDPEFVEGLKKTKELFDMGAFNSDAHTLDYAMGTQLYMDKKAAIIMDGGWSVMTLMSKAPKDVQDATEFAPVPVIPGGKGDADAQVCGAGWAFGINTNLDAEKSKAALDFLKEFTSPENAGNFYKVGYVPAAEPDTLDVSKLDPLMQRYLDTFSKLNTWTACYSVNLPGNVAQLLYQGLPDVMLGNITPEDYAQALQDEYDRE